MTTIDNYRKCQLYNENQKFYQIDRYAFDKIYNFSNVKAIHSNLEIFDPKLFTLDSPLIPPLLTFSDLRLEILNPFKPITFDMEYIPDDEFNNYIKTHVDMKFEHFQYNFGVISNN